MLGRRIFAVGAGLAASGAFAATAGAGESVESPASRDLEVTAFSVLATPMGSLARYRILNRGAGPVKARLLIVGLDTPMAWPAWRHRYARRWNRRLASHLGQRAVWKRSATLRPGANVRVVPLPAGSSSQRRFVLWVNPPAPENPGGRPEPLRPLGKHAACAEVGAAPHPRPPRRKPDRHR